MDFKKDFSLFAKDYGINSHFMSDYSNRINNSLTPYILDERSRNASPVDIYSRMLQDRILFFGEEFNSATCNVAVAELLYLSSLDSNKDISIYINSGGGSVVDGLGLIDTINYIPCSVSTMCIGMAASMGAVLLSCGEKGKRYVLPHSRVMLHQVSSGMSRSTCSDLIISLEQTKRCQSDLFNILSNNLGKTVDEIENICDRDNWFIGEEAVNIGIADSVVTKK